MWNLFSKIGKPDFSPTGYIWLFVTVASKSTHIYSIENNAAVDNFNLK